MVNVRAKRPRSVSTCEEINVADVIRFENDDERRRTCVESSPDVFRILGRGERIQKRDFGAGLNTR
jgi:hypothetical protein